MLKDNNGKLISLMPKSRKPKRLRKMIVDPEIISFIRRTREEHPGIGKEKIKPLLDKYCKERNIKTMSISTIGRIIKRYDMRYTPKEIGYHNPNSKWAKNKRLKRNKVHTNRIKHSPVSSSLGYIEIDTIVKFINGIKRYIYNAVDINTRFSFSYAYKSKNSKNALLFFKKLEKVYPEDKGMATVQTDNGSEYLGVFDKYLKDKHIKHLFAYPRCPRVNGYIERANRTLQEEFLNYHLFLLSDDIKAFNSQLIDYLIWYNTERPHHSLDNLSPIDFMIKYYLKSQMYRTYTLS
jgi:transposase InsO family protein